MARWISCFQYTYRCRHSYTARKPPGALPSRVSAVLERKPCIYRPYSADDLDYPSRIIRTTLHIQATYTCKCMIMVFGTPSPQMHARAVGGAVPLASPPALDGGSAPFQ